MLNVVSDRAGMSRQRWLHTCVTIAVVLAVGGVFTLLEHAVEEAVPEIRSEMNDFNAQTREGLAHLVALRIGWEFFEHLMERPCTCPGQQFLECSTSPSTVGSRCHGPISRASDIGLT